MSPRKLRRHSGKAPITQVNYCGIEFSQRLLTATQVIDRTLPLCVFSTYQLKSSRSLWSSRNHESAPSCLVFREELGQSFLFCLERRKLREGSPLRLDLFG